MSEFYVYQCVFIAQLSFMVSSACLTWSSPMLSKLGQLDDNPLGRIITSTENSLLASLNILGACFGSILFGALTSYFGRKTLLVISGFPSFISYLVMAWSSNIWIFYFTRFITGVCLGGTNTVLPMYSGEIADVHNRGMLGTSMAVSMNLGLLIPYTTGPYISFFWFHNILAIISALYMLLLFFFTLESPHYLITKNFAEAESVLKKLRGKNDVSKMLKDIRNDVENVYNGSFMDVIQSKGLRKAFLIGLGGQTFLQLTGAGIVASYNQKIFEYADIDMSAELGPIIVGITQLIASLVLSSVSDKYPRKCLLVLSFLGVSLVQIPFGVYFFLQNKEEDVSSISWLPLLSLVLFVIMLNIGVGPVLLTLLGELFPSKVKGIALSSIIVYSWAASFVLTSQFNTLSDLLGLGVLFLIFSFSSSIAAIFVKFIFVETKGKTLQEIQDELNK